MEFNTTDSLLNDIPPSGISAFHAWYDPCGNVERWGSDQDTLTTTVVYAYSTACRPTTSVTTIPRSIFKHPRGVGLDTYLYEFAYSADQTHDTIRTYHLPERSRQLEIVRTFHADGTIAAETIKEGEGNRLVEESTTHVERGGDFSVTALTWNDDSSWSRSTMKFDSNGFLLRKKFDGFRPNDSVASLTTTEVFINDSLGNPVLIVSECSECHGKVDSTSRSYRYDRYGNWTERQSSITVNGGEPSHAPTTRNRTIITRRIISYYQPSDSPEQFRPVIPIGGLTRRRWPHASVNPTSPH
ncbi:MAG: hypothetical protein JST22_17115 [Bacteroidetes bacterium]|nr:hypothetical protein [Bacteroidota bacterium]